jgi:hypothetical protein
MTLLDEPLETDSGDEGGQPVAAADIEREGSALADLAPAAIVRRLAAVSAMGKLGLVLAAVAMILVLWGGRTVDSADVDGYGLLFAFPPIYWVGVGVGIVASAVLMHRAVVERTRFAGFVPAIWLVTVHTAPHLAHEQFRFQTVWHHVGFVRRITETQTGDVLIDARFAWPGFFGSFMPSVGTVDQGVVDVMMRLWPTLLVGTTAILVGALANRSYPTVPLIAPLSATAYVMLAWTGQDYFSPQSFGFAAYLSILVLLESGPLRINPAWSASVPFLARFAAAGGERPMSRTTPVVVSLVILGFGSVVSHPLAPFFICMGMVIMGLYGRTAAWRLLVILGVTYLVWFFVNAEPWWATQLESMLSQVGSFFSNLDDSTTGRVRRSSPEHLFVTQVRTWVGIGTILLTFVIGVAMATDRFRHLRPALPLAPLAGIPSMALLLQSYGGEIVFRVILFTIPMAAILVGRVLAAIRLRALPVVVPLLVLAMLPWLLLARFGNEAFEKTTNVDRETFLAGFETAENETLFVLDNGFAPYQDRRVGNNSFAEIEAEASEEWIKLVQLVAQNQRKSRIIVFFTPSQAQWRLHGMESTVEYLPEVAEWLKARPGAQVLYDNGGGYAIELCEPGWSSCPSG